MKGLLFTYALTYGGALTSVFRPFVGLLVYVCFAILKPESLWFWSVPAGNYSRIVAMALLLGWAIQGFGKWQLGRARGVTFALLAFWVWGVLSAVLAPQQEVSLGFVEDMAKIVLPFLVGITMIDSMQQLKQLAWVILLSQGYVAFELNLSYLNGFNRLAEIGFGGMDNNCMGVGLNACIGVALFLGLYAERWWQKGLALGAALLIAHAILLSFSRGGMLGLMVTGLVAFFLIPKRPAHYALFLLAVLIVLRLAGEQVQARFMSSFGGKEGRDWSANSRLELWSDCIDCTIKNPVLGIGPRHWPLIAEQYGWTAGKSAHTLWLEVAAELGVPGLFFLVLFYSLCIWRLIPLLRGSFEEIDPWPSYLACMVVASIVGFAVSGQFVSLVGLEIPYYVALIGAGVLKVTSLKQPTSEQDTLQTSDNLAELVIH